jgi:hypothetical protein
MPEALPATMADHLPIRVPLHLDRLTTAWGTVEVHTTLILAELIGNDGSVASAMLHQVANLHHRSKLTKDVAEVANVSDKINKEAKAITGEIKVLANLLCIMAFSK